MNEVLIPIIAFWFANITGIPQKFRRALNRQSLKPLDCAKCLAFWLAFAYQLYIGFTVQSLFIIPLSSLGGYFCEYLASKLKMPVNL